MTIEAIMSRISAFLKMILEGSISGSYTDQESIIIQWTHFIVDHKIIFFFVMCGFVYLGISILRRLIHT